MLSGPSVSCPCPLPSPPLPSPPLSQSSLSPPPHPPGGAGVRRKSPRAGGTNSVDLWAQGSGGRSEREGSGSRLGVPCPSSIV